MEIRGRILFCHGGIGHDWLRPFHAGDNWRQSLLHGLCDGKYCIRIRMATMCERIPCDSRIVFDISLQVGIPLGLVMFQSIGERLNKFVSVFIRRAKIYIRCAQTDATETNLMLFNGMLSSIIITTGAAVFSRYEGWSYFDSFYYCFVTLTTIGFGDYVALQNDQALMNKPGYVALSLVFILFGLAVVAASINLLVLRFMTM